MAPGGDDQDTRRRKHFDATEAVKARFIKCLTPDFIACTFAKQASDSSLLEYNVIHSKDMHTPAAIDPLILVATQRKKMCVVIMPSVKTEVALARFLSSMGTGERWVIRATTQSKFGDARSVEMEWQHDGVRASVLGFFPSGRMPVTRRTPYAAIAVWAAGAGNQHRRRTSDVLGPGDMPVAEGITTSGYRQMRRDIMSHLESIRDEEFEPMVLEHTTFCIGEDALRSAGVIP